MKLFNLPVKFFNQNYTLLVIITLFLVGIIIYSNTFFSSFNFDDIPSIVGNFSIRNPTDLKTIWGFRPTRFITYFSLALNYHFHELNVFGYHLFNLIVHLCSAIVVWWLTLLTFSTPLIRANKISQHAKLISFFIGLIFLVHPIQTQSVTYIIQRASSLAALFYLVSLTLYVKSRLLQYEKQPLMVWTPFYITSLVMAVMSMFTKEMTFTLPLMVLLYEFCFLKTKKNINWGQLILFFFTLFIIPLVMLITKSVNFKEMRLVSEPVSGISPWHYLLTQFRVMITYIRLLFVPLSQNLDYDYPISRTLLEFSTFSSFIVLAIILVIAVKLFLKYRLISFGIFWFFLTLLPESSIIPIKDVIFEHRLYLPMVGYSFFLVSIIYYFLHKKNLKVMILMLIIIVSWYSFLTYARNFVWRDEVTLLNDVIKKSPNKVRAYKNRGSAYALEGNFDRAIFDFSRAISIEPGDSALRVNLGNAYASKNNFTQAFSCYNKALDIDPKDASVYYNRAVAYFLKKEYDRAWEDIHNAEKLGYKVNPGFLEELKKISGREK